MIVDLQMDTHIVDSLKSTCIAKGFTLHVLGTPDNPLFPAKQIGILIGLVRIRGSIKSYNCTEKVMLITRTQGGDQSIACFTMAGIKRLISVCRKPAAIQLARLLGIEVISKVCPHETTTLCQIIDSFNGEDMVIQYSVGKYYIDMYFPKYKLAIECDEDHHDTQKGKYNDSKRQEFIISQLGCTFIRYKPHVKGFNIFNVINAIYKHIIMHNCSK